MFCWELLTQLFVLKQCLGEGGVFLSHFPSRIQSGEVELVAEDRDFQTSRQGRRKVEDKWSGLAGG